MLTFLLLLALVMSSAAFGAWIMKTYLEATASERQAVLRQELAALRAAQAINLAAWQSRQSLHDLGSDQRPPNLPPFCPGH